MSWIKDRARHLVKYWVFITVAPIHLMLNVFISLASPSLSKDSGISKTGYFLGELSFYSCLAVWAVLELMLLTLWIVLGVDLFKLTASICYCGYMLCKEIL